MNSTVYFFGDFGQGLTLYPNDYTKSIYETFIDNAIAPTQLTIHRDGAIMNYAYIKKIENNHFFGICVQINGQYLTSTNWLFELFETIITNIIVRGELLRLNNEGNIIGNINKFTDKSGELESTIIYCQNEFLNLDSICQILPSIDYSSLKSDIKKFRDIDDNVKIVNSTISNGYTFIYKVRDYDSLALRGYRSSLKSLNNQNEKNKKEVEGLNRQLAILKRQKKQMNVVVGLTLLLFVGAIMFFNAIEVKNDLIKDQNDTIINKDGKIESQNIEKKQLLDIIANNHIKIETVENANTKLIVKCDSIRDENISLNSRYNALLLEFNSFKATQQKSYEDIKAKCNKYEKLSLNYKSIIATKEIEYKDLSKKFNLLNKDFYDIKNKYYSTKEGKKESKNK